MKILIFDRRPSNGVGSGSGGRGIGPTGDGVGDIDFVCGYGCVDNDDSGGHINGCSGFGLGGFDDGDGNTGLAPLVFDTRSR